MAEDKMRPVELNDESLEGVAGGLTDNYGGYLGVPAIATCTCGWTTGKTTGRKAKTDGALHENTCSQGGTVTVEDYIE